MKNEIINNVLVTMSCYINDADVLKMLEDVLSNELVKVRIEKVTTLPAEWKNDAEKRNAYLIQLFMIKKRGLSKETMEGYLRSVKRFMLMVNKPLDQVDTLDIEWYLATYEKRPGQKKKQIENSTYNNERRYLSAFYTWMRKAKLISENPVEAIEAKKVVRKPIDYFSREEIIKLRDACVNARERALIEVFRSTGARVGEIAQIQLEQVNFLTGDILICGEKGGRYRNLYLDEEARHYYLLYKETRKDNSPYLFTQSRKPYGQLTKCAYRTALKTIGRRAGLTIRVYPHKMRKTLGMDLKNKGVDLGVIQEVLGHASPAVTSLYYAQSTTKTLRDIRERLAA